MPSIKHTAVLSSFTCLGDRCEDTCCQNWSMQVDESTRETYRRDAPELLDAIEPAAETPWIMRKDPATGFCVKLDGGLCGIHKNYGDRFLGDACHFYPRVTRQLGSQVVMTATMSCPEIMRRVLAEKEPCAMEEWNEDRLPHSMKNYLPEGLAEADALAIHEAFIAAAADDSIPVEHAFLHIASASRSLERIDVKSWPAMTPFYLKNAAMRLTAAVKHNADPFNALHALCGLIVASHKPPSLRLRQTIEAMEKALVVTLDWDKVQIHTSDQSLPAYEALKKMWDNEAAASYAPVLRRWLAMQMSLALYPFSGLGNNLSERATIIGMRLAIIKLALLCNHSIYGTYLPPDVVVRVVQSLSRFLDHLGDPAFSLHICTETGWTGEGRMRGLLEG